MKKTTKAIKKFIDKNGSYLLAEEVWERILCSIRGYFLGKSLKTRSPKIGSGYYIRGVSNISIGNGFRAGKFLWLEAVTSYNDQSFCPQIIIGDRVQVHHWVHIAATNSVEIGEDCLLGSRILITDHGHGVYSSLLPQMDHPPASRQLDANRRVKIGKNVWLGDGVVILPDVEIGEGAVIGANSVVCKDIPQYAVAAGVPARVIKQFDPDTHAWIFPQQD